MTFVFKPENYPTRVSDAKETSDRIYEEFAVNNSTARRKFTENIALFGKLGLIDFSLYDSLYDICF